MLLLFFFIFLGISQKENSNAFINNIFTKSSHSQKKTLNLTIFEEEKKYTYNSTNLVNSTDLKIKNRNKQKITKQDKNAGCDNREQDDAEDEVILMKLKKQLCIHKLLTILQNPHTSQKRKLEAWYENMDYIDYIISAEKHKSKFVFNLSQGGLFNSWNDDFEL